MKRPTFALRNDAGIVTEFDLVQLFNHINLHDRIKTELNFPQIEGTFPITEEVYVNLAQEYGHFIGAPEELFKVDQIKQYYRSGEPFKIRLTTRPQSEKHHINFGAAERSNVVFQLNDCTKDGAGVCFLNKLFKEDTKPYRFEVNVFGDILNGDVPASFEFTGPSLSEEEKFVRIKTASGVLKHYEIRMKPYPEAGVCHWGGRYTIGPDPVLVDGAKAIKHLKFKHIKLYAGNTLKEAYGIDAKMNLESLKELLETPQYKEVLRMPFKTVVLVCFSMFSGSDDYWKKSSPLTEKEVSSEEAEFRSLSEYLQKTYPNKNFILQNWESDNAVFPGEESVETKKMYLINLSNLINARIRGITNSKANNVYSAIEVNSIVNLLENPESYRVANTILPHLNVDYVSYSCYDSLFKDSATLGRCIDYLRGVVSPVSDVFIGEWGFPLLEMDPEVARKLLRGALGVFADRNIPIHFYWQIYDNEKKGFFIIRPNNTLSLAGMELLN
jgi:hypothetical protein